MNAGETDAEVIASSLARPERFEVIFDRHGAAVYRYLRRRVRDHLAEELAAETFARALRSRQQFNATHSSALPWLYGIAVNLIRMHQRSETRRHRAYSSVAESARFQPSATAEAETRLDAHALGPALSAALEALPTDQREVLLLYAWAELSPAEIAQALALSPAAVRKRLQRARATASQRLEQCAQEPIETLPTRTAQ